MDDDGHAVGRELHVEFEKFESQVERRLEGGQRVFREVARVAAVGDQLDRSCSARKVRSLFLEFDDGLAAGDDDIAVDRGAARQRILRAVTRPRITALVAISMLSVTLIAPVTRPRTTALTACTSPCQCASSSIERSPRTLPSP